MTLIRKALDFQVRQVGDPEERILEFIGSTAVVDRYGDIIEVAGWDLANYKNNPIFLWAHNSSLPPLGRAVSVKKTADALVFQIKFASREEYGGEWPAIAPSPETIYNLYLNGYLRATSVGFSFIEREPIIDPKSDGRQTGWRFLKQELYELSAVPVPANPEALMLAVQKGIISQADADAFPQEAPETPQVNDIDQRLTELGLPSLEEATDPARGCAGYDFTKTILALCDLVKDLQERLAKAPDIGFKFTLSDEQVARLQASWEGAMAKAGAVLNAKNKEALTQARDLIDQVLAAAEGSTSNGKSTAPNQSIYSLALNPGQEPPGGRPAGDSLNLAEILEGTKELHQMICPAN
ncbi:MAG: HK97 family phage prohead protease [Thermodesulfobacteriota bacterium]